MLGSVESGLEEGSASGNRKGKKFERYAREHAVPLIVARLGLQPADVACHANVKWLASDPSEPNLGEIDLCLTDNAVSRVVALVECKANLYDIGHAYHQSGPQRNPLKNRIRLGHHQQPLEVPRETPVFVVTQIERDDQYLFRYDHRVREELSRVLRGRLLRDVPFDEAMRILLRPSFAEELSSYRLCSELLGENQLVVFEEFTDK